MILFFFFFSEQKVELDKNERKAIVSYLTLIYRIQWNMSPYNYSSPMSLLQYNFNPSVDCSLHGLAIYVSLMATLHLCRNVYMLHSCTLSTFNVSDNVCTKVKTSHNVTL